MKGKKILAAALGLLAISGTTQIATAAKPLTEQTQQEKQLPPTPAAQNMAVSRRSSNMFDFSFGSGTSPKAYGMYLQDLGLQKWNKKSNTKKA